MYVPPSFHETDLTQLHDFIEQHDFATLVSTLDGEPFATHLPLLLERNAGPQGRLLGHLALANPQGRTASGPLSLAIFHGPHAYISPGWIDAPNVVPTWNYVVVHVYGTLQLIDDRERLRAILQRMVARYESDRTAPWSMAGPDPEFLEHLLGAIVGVEMVIDRIEGKWKLSQNHPRERREQVVTGLRKTSRPGAGQIAELMTRQIAAS